MAELTTRAIAKLTGVTQAYHSITQIITCDEFDARIMPSERKPSTRARIRRFSASHAAFPGIDWRMFLLAARCFTQ
jgi:hypothetical protein